MQYGFAGKIASNRTLNIVYGGTGLTSDTDYSWTVTWWDSTGAMSTPASATFSVALLNPTTDFAGAIWLSSNGPNGTGSLNTYRSAPITLPATPVRARLYVAGMGYAKTWINGQLTDDHELGTVGVQHDLAIKAFRLLGFRARGCANSQ